MPDPTTSSTIREACGVKLYDADDGIFAGYCALPKKHKKPHAISYELNLDSAEKTVRVMGVTGPIEVKQP